jgi:hypothetical protein
LLSPGDVKDKNQRKSGQTAYKPCSKSCWY